MKRPASNDWDADRYESHHSYVWSLGADLLAALAPKAGERILDLGCGTGQLTHQIAERGATVIGIDSAPAMIDQARANFPELDFRLADATGFTVEEPVDAVFSNAALHWVRDQDAALTSVERALKPGGRFVAELGGKGNIRSIMEALAAVLGTVENPWYFPSVGEYATLLERHGFHVSQASLFDRPTPLQGESILEDWMAMFAGMFFAGVPEPERAEAQRRVAESLRARLFRDGQWVLDYRRLRVLAFKEPPEGA